MEEHGPGGRLRSGRWQEVGVAWEDVVCEPEGPGRRGHWPGSQVGVVGETEGRGWIRRQGP